MPKVFYELIDNKSSKFWHAEHKGDTHTVKYGRIGTAGQAKSKSFADSVAAKQAFDKLVQQKVAKGYIKVNAKVAAKHTVAATAVSTAASKKSTRKTSVTTVPKKSSTLAKAKKNVPSTSKVKSTAKKATTRKATTRKATTKKAKTTPDAKPAKLDTRHLLTLLKKKARGADEIALKKKLKAANPTASKSEILRLAGKWDATEVVKALVAAQVDLNVAAKEEFYTFNVAITKLMLESGFNAKKLADRWLGSAVTHGKTPIVELLLQGGAKATPTGAKSISFLVKALENNRPQIAQLLIDAGVDVNKPSYKGRNSPLMEACEQGDLKMVKRLLKAGAKVDYQDNSGSDALMSVLRNPSADSFSIVKTLISAGSDVNRSCKHGWTPLMVAAGFSSDTCVKFLLKKGADPQCVTKMGTPLMAVARKNKPVMIPILIKAGVNPNWKFGPKAEKHLRGRTALDVAREWKSRRVIPLLEEIEQQGKPKTPTRKTKQGTQPAVSKQLPKLKIGNVAQSWKKIEAWLKTNDPERFKSLAKPAKAAVISKLEKATGCKLPKDVLDSYKIHDGQTGFSTLVQDDDSGSYYLLPVKEMLSEWKVWDDLIKYGEFEGDLSQPDKGVRGDKWFNLNWIPLMSNGGGDSYCIDMDPAKGGKVGQIITMNHEHGRRELLAPSLKDFLGKLAHDLENGLMIFDDDE